jgi:tetratricopeptide (TPR) repeat protein
MDRRQGHWEKAIQEFKDPLERDPGNSVSVENLALTLERTRQFRAAEQMFDRLIALRPDLATLQAQKPLVIYRETGDDAAIRAAIAAFPGSISDDRGVLCLRLSFAFVGCDWAQAKALIEKLDGGDDNSDFAYAEVAVPVGCYSILLHAYYCREDGFKSSPNHDTASERSTCIVAFR